MNSSFQKLLSPAYRSRGYAGLAALAVMGGVCAFAYRTLTYRPGEAALAHLVPDDALAVLSVDLKPT